VQQEAQRAGLAFVHLSYPLAGAATPTPEQTHDLLRRGLAVTEATLPRHGIERNANAGARTAITRRDDMDSRLNGQLTAGSPPATRSWMQEMAGAW
jgi:hypothetical protein